MPSYRPFLLEITGTLTPEAPLHVGTGGQLAVSTDAPILRDSKGRPYIPASSLRGVLSHLVAGDYGKSGVFLTLFGFADEGNGDGAYTRLRIADGVAPNGADSEVRDHVSIDPATGAAARGAKFDQEVALNTGSFSFQAWYEGEKQDDPELGLLLEGIRRMEDGELTFGAKSGWGYGRMRLGGVEFRRFLRSEDEGLASYFSYRLGGKDAGDWERPAPHGPNLGAGAMAVLDFTLLLQFDGPVLVRAPIPPVPAKPGWDLREDHETYAQTGAKLADGVFLQRLSDQQYYLPGSSLRGVVRRHAEKICAATGRLETCKILFGELKSDGQGRRGRIEVGDGELVGEKLVYLDHVAIDRITAAAMDGAKFANSALASPQFRTTVRLRFPEPEGAALALWGFVLRDMKLGRLWAGSGVTRGYGHIATVKVESVRVGAPTWLGLDNPGNLPRVQCTLGADRLDPLWQFAQRKWEAR